MLSNSSYDKYLTAVFSYFTITHVTVHVKDPRRIPTTYQIKYDGMNDDGSGWKL